MAGRTGRRFRQRLALSNVVVVPDAQFRQGFLPCYIATPSACGSNPGQYVTVRNLRTGMLPSPITSGPPRTARNSPRTACRRGPPTPSVIPLKRRGFLTDLTAIHGAGRYLLRLMKAKSVTLAGGGIGIRALLDDEQSPVVSGGHLSPAQGRSQPRR